MANSDFFYLLAEYLQRQFKYLKDNLKKCLDRRANMTKSGAAARSLPTCNYFNQMLYLVEGVGNQPTESNLENTVRECQAPPSAEYKYVEETSLLEPLCQAPVTKKPRFSTSKKLSEPSLESELRQQIASINEYLKETPQKKSEAALFCDSLIPQLESIPEKEFRRTRIKIEQLIFEVMYGDD